jgi:hypothetical protein
MRLRDAVRRNRFEVWPSSWFLQYDKAPDHQVLIVKKSVAITSPRSLYLAVSDLRLSQKVKPTLKRLPGSRRLSEKCDDCAGCCKKKR